MKFVKDIKATSAEEAEISQIGLIKYRKDQNITTIEQVET